jgi:NADH dehydrogenase [ubiquinone] 1 alpha subcomplex assembly factor 5
LSAIDKNYKNYEYLKDETGFRVADRVFDIKRTFNTILDLGCSRGYVSKHFTKETVKKVYMLDMCEKLLENAYTPENGIDIVKIVHDEEANLPFDDNSIDLVVSNLR